jgi:acetyl-CoA carboxylase biotin carboxylase subunit
VSVASQNLGNIPLQARIMKDKTFRKGGMNIHYLEKMLGESHS